VRLADKAQQVNRAGAIWRTHATPDQAEICDWNVKSYREWMRLLDEMPGKAQQMGLQVGLGVDFRERCKIDFASAYRLQFTRKSPRSIAVLNLASTAQVTMTKMTYPLRVFGTPRMCTTFPSFLLRASSATAPKAGIHSYPLSSIQIST